MKFKFKVGDRVKILPGACLQTVGQIAKVIGNDEDATKVMFSREVINKVYSIPLNKVSVIDKTWWINNKNLEKFSIPNTQLVFDFMKE